jgi:hypothetical protein
MEAYESSDEEVQTALAGNGCVSIISLSMSDRRDTVEFSDTGRAFLLQ